MWFTEVPTWKAGATFTIASLLILMDISLHTMNAMVVFDSAVGRLESTSRSELISISRTDMKGDIVSMAARLTGHDQSERRPAFPRCVLQLSIPLAGVLSAQGT